MGYWLAGFEVVGVDKAPQPHYPFEFVQADVLSESLLDAATCNGRFHFIHASPPCQSFTAYRRKGHGVGDGYENLIEPVRRLLLRTGLPFVIENVEAAREHLRDPVRLCGSSFGLDVRRHRLFEVHGFRLEGKACDHAWQTPRFPPATNRTNKRRTVEVGAFRCAKFSPKAMGIDWMDNHEISEALPPAYTKWIGEQVLRALR